MPDSLRPTENLTELLCKLHGLIDVEQDAKMRVLLTNIQELIADQVDSNKIINEQSVILRRHNDELASFQSTGDKVRGMLMITFYLLGIAQVLIIGAVTYVFGNTEKLLKNNELLVQETQHLNEKIVQHQAVTDNMMRSFKFDPPYP
jgi:hypothetical protein